MITVSKEDYLKAIAEAEAEGQTVISATLAHWLAVSRPAVTAALKRLKKDGMVTVKNDGRIQLTPQGRRISEQTIFRHHLIERMLAEIFGMPWYAVHEEAERLEHFISERFEDRVAAILGDPEIDPHGHPIPRKYEAGVYRREVPLAQWPLDAPAVISSVSDRDASALRELERLGLTPGVTLRVERKNSSGSLSVRLAAAAPIRLSQDLAECILIGADPSV